LIKSILPAAVQSERIPIGVIPRINSLKNFLFYHPIRFLSCSVIVTLLLIPFSVFAQEKGILSIKADTSRVDSVPLLSPKDTTVLSAKGKDYKTIFRGDTLLKSPWGAVLRSFIIPGWGQWYNESKWKVPVFISTDGTMLYFYNIKDKKVQSIERKRRRIDRQLKTDPFLTPSMRSILSRRFSGLTSDLDGALNRRNLYGWLFALSHLLGMVDAYVDAHLFEFDTKMDLALRPTPTGCALTWTLELK
jgi:hypothetical protein